MNISIHPLAAAIALAAAATLLSTGCYREEPATPATAATAAPKTTVGTEIDDTVVTTKVKSALVADQEVRGVELKVETRKGVVQLSGFANNQAQLDRAITVARGIEGVKSVENGMTLKEGKSTVGNKVDDGIVTTKVKSALLADPSVKSFDIAVATNKGEVQLSGFVDNQSQIDQAILLARGVEGVQGVENKMTIKK